MDETFQVFDRVLSFAGIPIFKKRNWNSKRWLFFQIFNFVLGFLTFIFTSCFVISNYSNLLLCIQGACIWVTGVIMFISLGVCLVFRKEFQGFLSEMSFRDGIVDMPFIVYVLGLGLKHGKLGELKYLVVNSQEKLLKFTRVLLKTYVASVWLSATLYLCGPIYQMCIREDESLRLLDIHLYYKETKSWYKAARRCHLLAFDMWFPWNLENFNIYVASFIFHAYAGYLCCIAYPGLQSVIILLVGQTIRNLRILSFVLLHLDELVRELHGTRNYKWQICCTKIFAQCVEHYVKIKRFSNRLNIICQPFYLVLILAAIILICTCSVKIAISDKLSLDIMKYYVHEFCFILVVLMFCLAGQQVENECEKLEAAVTEKWYLFNRIHKVNIRIFKMALSQRMPIYIFGSITLSLSTFTWFLRSGMSFFTVVMSVLED